MPHRFICDVLSEMRTCNDTRNYSYLLGLIEEAQTAANRMEAALHDQKDYIYYSEKLHAIKKEYHEASELQYKIDQLSQQKKKLEDAIKKLKREYSKETKTDGNACIYCNKKIEECQCDV